MSSSARAAPPPFTIAAPRQQTLPLVVASPHSGRYYPPRFRRQSRLPVTALRRSEDCFVDELAAAAPRLGAPLITAGFARVLIDPNREPLELDPRIFSEPLPGYANTDSPRVRSGLGTIPRLAANGAEIYWAPLAYAEARRRLLQYYLPYHKALRGLINQTRARFGFALLVDCHSMPAQAASGAPRALGGGGLDFVLGDCHGGACASAVTDRAERLLRDMNYAVGLNYPYAGGFTTKYYGRPEDGVHAVQLEINRGLYMDENRLKPTARLAALAEDLARLFAGLADTAPMALAAE